MALFFVQKWIGTQDKLAQYSLLSFAS